MVYRLIPAWLIRSKVSSNALKNTQAYYSSHLLLHLALRVLLNPQHLQFFQTTPTQLLKAQQAVTVLYVVLDHVRDFLRNRIKSGAQVSRDLSGHHARVDDAHIRAIVQAQTTVDDTAKVAPHHRARRDGVRDGNKVIPNPTAPVCVRAGLGVVRYTVEPRAGLTRREIGEGCGAE